MSARAYLEVHPGEPIDPTNENVLCLYGTKRMIPFGWFLFFEESDFEALDAQGEVWTVLKRPLQAAMKVARRRTKAIRQVATGRFVKLLDAYLEAIEQTAAQGILVLNSSSIDASQEELLAPTRWLNGLQEAPRPEALEQGAELFWDDDEGVSWTNHDFEDFDPDDGDPVMVMNFYDAGRVIGFESAAPEIEVPDEPASLPEGAQRPPTPTDWKNRGDLLVVSPQRVLASLPERKLSFAETLDWLEALWRAGHREQARAAIAKLRLDDRAERLNLEDKTNPYSESYLPDFSFELLLAVMKHEGWQRQPRLVLRRAWALSRLNREREYEDEIAALIGDWRTEGHELGELMSDEIEPLVRLLSSPSRERWLELL